VLAKLDLWWQCALRSLQSGGGEVSTLSYDAYKVISRLMHKAMIEEWDEDDAEQCAAEDWLTDSAGSPVMNEERFKDCMFELADASHSSGRTPETPRQPQRRERTAKATAASV
jgi:hypothetical protein